MKGLFLFMSFCIHQVLSRPHMHLDFDLKELSKINMEEWNRLKVETDMFEKASCCRSILKEERKWVTRKEKTRAWLTDIDWLTCSDWHVVSLLTSKVFLQRLPKNEGKAAPSLKVCWNFTQTCHSFTAKDKKRNITGCIQTWQQAKWMTDSGHFDSSLCSWQPVLALLFLLLNAVVDGQLSKMILSSWREPSSFDHHHHDDDVQHVRDQQIDENAVICFKLINIPLRKQQHKSHADNSSCRMHKV